MEPRAPLVSIITATYNRGNVLCYTIAGVRRSRFTDWEMIVVGDACTDDTEERVASFNDSRIRFFNLEKNFGDQGGPNNEGLRHARGRYVAYLSHDDLWSPDHLQTALTGIEESGADLVFTLGIAVSAGNSNQLLGAVPSDCYQPIITIPASLWMARRELLVEIGPWKHPRECYVSPSQDLLLRAWRAGKKIRRIPKPTVIAIQAGSRPGVYARREFEEDRAYFERMRDEADFWEKELLNIALHRSISSEDLLTGAHFRRGIINLLKRIGVKFGIAPVELVGYLLYRRKGGFINSWRRRIGLSKLD
ncbi:MAG: glycosyltransferase family 2 protein [Deltaproteobacteria bacterium]|nr:glycosyltransferase family 2 protein [Deltaproteobacteria bacterium]